LTHELAVVDGYMNGLRCRLLELAVGLACGEACWCLSAALWQSDIVLASPARATLKTPALSPSAPDAAAEMGRRKNKGASVSTPKWEERDDISPFKLAEKRLKRYTGKETDFSCVLDPASALQGLQGAAQDRDAAGNDQGAGPSGRSVEGSSSCEGRCSGARVVNVPGRDGLVVLPGFLSEEEQLALALRCLADYPSPPHRTNLTPQHGVIERLWETRSDLFEQLRWVTLGYQYDWTNRTYPLKDRVSVPPELCHYAAAASEAGGRRAVKAEAVIVNYYTLSSTLGGHLDDVEPDQETVPYIHSVERDLLQCQKRTITVMWNQTKKRCHVFIHIHTYMHAYIHT